MAEHITAWLGTISPEWKTLIIAMLPIVELRGAIPWALVPESQLGGGLSWPLAYLLSVVGNMLPIVPILLFLEPASRLLSRISFMGRFFEWLFARTRRRAKVVDRYGAIGLILFVMIPLPVTGAWTGAAAAFVFGVPFRKALPSILVGVLLSGVIVTLLSTGALHLFSD